MLCGSKGCAERRSAGQASKVVSAMRCYAYQDVQFSCLDFDFGAEGATTRYPTEAPATAPG